MMAQTPKPVICLMELRDVRECVCIHTRMCVCVHVRARMHIYVCSWQVDSLCLAQE